MKSIFVMTVFCCLGVSSAYAKPLPSTVLTLEKVVALALQNDPWLTGSEWRQQAAIAESEAAGQLPDPTVTLNLANLPIDSFDFGQEAMTQLNVGVAQVFPRGQSRALKRRQWLEFSEQHPLQRADRRAKVVMTVTQLWLEMYRQSQSIALIKQDRVLFEHLVNIAQTSYTSAQGKSRQQDLIRAQLELTRLDDRLVALYGQHDSVRAQLLEWLSGPGLELGVEQVEVSSNLPGLHLVEPKWLDLEEATDAPRLYDLLKRHPAIVAIEQKLKADNTGVELARQLYRPQWGVSANYGYRDADPSGRDRADFFSVGIHMDVPLFPAKRQDKKLQAALAGAETVKTEKALLLRSMKAGFESTLAKLRRLNQRQTLYRTRLLDEVHEQAEATLTAYTNDDGTFVEVARARIAELNARIDALNIDIDRLQTVAQLNYFFAGVDHATNGFGGKQ